MTTTTTTPRVWVGCLGCYNAGKLIGVWVDATEATEVTPATLGLVPDIYDLHEELWVFDHEGFGGFASGEFSPYEAQRIAEAMEAIPNHIDPDAVGLWLADRGLSITEADLGEFEEAYAGEWDSEEDFAQDHAEQMGSLQEDASWPYTYINWEAAARDLFLGDYWSERDASGQLHVFRRN